MSDRVTNTQLHRTLLRSINDASSRAMSTREQLSTGYKVNRPSDDPAATGRIITLQHQSDSFDQYAQNLAAAKSWTDSSETAIAKVYELLVRVRTLTLQGTNDSSSQSDRQSIANEIAGIVDNIKTQGNAKVGDNYLFSGTRTSQVPYTVGGGDAYAGNMGAITREIAPGVQVDVNQLGVNVFGNAGSGPISVLRSIATHLTSGIPGDIDLARGADINNLDASMDNVLTSRSKVGELSSRFDFTSDRLGSLKQFTTELLSQEHDTDFAEATVTYSQRQAALEAALRTGQDIVQPSLVDFMTN